MTPGAAPARSRSSHRAGIPVLPVIGATRNGQRQGIVWVRARAHRGWIGAPADGPAPEAVGAWRADTLRPTSPVSGCDAPRRTEVLSCAPPIEKVLWRSGPSRAPPCAAGRSCHGGQVQAQVARRQAQALDHIVAVHIVDLAGAAWANVGVRCRLQRAHLQRGGRIGDLEALKRPPARSGPRPGGAWRHRGRGPEQCARAHGRAIGHRRSTGAGPGLRQRTRRRSAFTSNSTRWMGSNPAPDRGCSPPPTRPSGPGGPPDAGLDLVPQRLGGGQRMVAVARVNSIGGCRAAGP